MVLEFSDKIAQHATIWTGSLMVQPYVVLQKEVHGQRI